MYTVSIIGLDTTSPGIMDTVLYVYYVWVLIKSDVSFINIGGPKKDRLLFRYWVAVYLAALSDFLGRSTAWMLGRTPPWAMVTPASSLFSSSSFLMASWR